MVKVIHSSLKNKASTEYEGLRVLYVGSPPLFSEGASAVHMMKMCQAMTRLGISVECVLPGSFSKEKLFEYYGVTTPFPVTFIPFTGGPGRQVAHGFVSSLYARIKRKSYDFVLTRNLIFSWLSVQVLGIPTIYDAHHPPVNIIAKQMIKAFSVGKNMLGMSFNSEGLRKIYSQLGIDTRNSVVAPNGVDVGIFREDVDMGSLRERLGLPVNRKIVCYCGNTYRGRGIEVLVEAAEKLPEVEFLIVGGREEDNSFYRKEAERRKISNFKMRGFVPQNEVSYYLTASDILVMPYSSRMTIKDGTKAGSFTSPLKLFEYMAAGKPIIATETPSVMEVLEPGKNSVTVPTDNPERFINSIEYVLRDTEFSLEISENALLDVKKYRWENRAKRIIKGLGIITNA